ncbi:MAG: hypothetical protein CVT89_05210, partial [Candidatus Altiarchaeales archaeon HGW-Altiarchaeales-2]
FYVEKTEKIDKAENYKILYTRNGMSEDNTTAQIKYILYVNKENGSMTQFILQLTDEKVILEEYVIFDKVYMYSPWMLALTDDLKWNITTVIETMEKNYNYRVLGREKINARECFKIERIHKTGNIIDEKVILWVDVDKRILVKAERYYENLKLGEVNLIDYSSI